MPQLCISFFFAFFFEVRCKLINQFFEHREFFLHDDGSEYMELALSFSRTGEMISEIFVMDENSFFSEDLRALGLGLGRFVYLMDGWCDRKKDAKHGVYNPFGPSASWDEAKELMIDAAAEAGAAFERLPLDQHVPILRNILYSGIWMRARREETGNDDRSV